MTRKDYKLIAECIHATLDEYGNASPLADVAERLADALKRDNPAFDRDRFFEACGLNEAH